MTPSEELERAEREMEKALAYEGERGVSEVIWELDWMCEVRRLRGLQQNDALD